MPAVKSFTLLTTLIPLVLIVMPAALEAGEYDPSPAGTRWLEGTGGLAIKVLVEASNLGGNEVEVGEITIPAGSAGSPHAHQSIEIFYVLSGQLDHIVNGEVHSLGPGMVGVVRPGDRVGHRVPADQDVKALVIWAPGGEAERLSQFLRSRPVEEEPEESAGH